MYIDSTNKGHVDSDLDVAQDLQEAFGELLQVRVRLLHAPRHLRGSPPWYLTTCKQGLSYFCKSLLSCESLSMYRTGTKH